MRTRIARSSRLALVGLAILLGAPGRSLAQATVLLDPLDPAYRQIDQLAAAGLLGRVIAGQRPYSRRHVAQLVVHAESTLALLRSTADSGQDPSPVAAALSRAEARLPLAEAALAQLRSDFAWEIARLSGTDSVAGTELSPVRSATIDLTGTSSPTRLIPPSNGLGEIDADLNPLLANRQGRPLVQGGNLLLSTTHTYQSRHIAAAITPELYLETPSSGSTRVLGNLQELYARALFGNLAVDIGREYQVWGQGRDVGLLGSDNSPPLDLIKLSSDTPFRLPWIFHSFGPTLASIFYADLGPRQNFPHPYFIGYKVSITPASWLELGGTVYTKAGGKGGPTTKFWKRVGDIFPFIESNFYGHRFGAIGNYNFSDRYAGLDGRVRIPDARGAELYTELLLNDFDIRRLESVFWEDAGHVAGLSLPRLTDDGRLGLTVEYHHTGIRYYEHDQFLSGQTLRRQLIGDPLGPDGQAGYVIFDWTRTERHRLEIDAAVERRSHDEYAYAPEPNFGFIRTVKGPREWRYRMTGTWRTLPTRGNLGLLVQGGYERTRNFDFVQSDDRNGLLARAGMEIRFR